MHTAEISGPDIISPLQVHSWWIRPSLKGAQYDIEYKYRRLPDGENEWIPLDYMEAQVFARPSDTALEFTSTVKDYWTNELVTAVKHVSVKPLQLNVSSTIFPNPTNGIFVIKLPAFLKDISYEVEVFSISGKRIDYFTSNEREFVTLDLRGKTDGLYTILLKAEGQVYSEQVILQH
jgi:hypothetical protein